MVEFEPPKRQALSDAELHRAISLLGNSAEGLSRAEDLIAQQAKLREQDSLALSSWISEMQRDGSAPAQRALAKIVLEVLPTEVVETAPASQTQVAPEAVPLFTSEIKTLNPRKLNRRRNGLFGSIAGHLQGILAASLSAPVIAAWLDLSMTESLISVVFGTVFSSLVQLLLRSHALHPLLRTAAVFGGWGVYLGAALILAGISLVIVEGALSTTDHFQLNQLIPGFPSEILLAGIGAVLLSQVLIRPAHKYVGLGLGAAFFLLPIAAGLKTDAIALSSPNLEPVLWGSLAIALVGMLVQVFGQPHQRVSAKTAAPQSLITIVLSVIAIYFQEFVLTPFLLVGLVLYLLATSGRDLAAGWLGRLAGLAIIIPIAALPLLDLLAGSIVAMFVTVLILVIFDQVFRKTPLHIPSLDTSYGFYGSFQPFTWIPIALAAIFGLESVQQLLLPDSIFTTTELSLIFGFVLGLTFALIRIFIIRNQDREIRNVEFRNMNLDNLLGL